MWHPIVLRSRHGKKVDLLLAAQRCLGDEAKQPMHPIVVLLSVILCVVGRARPEEGLGRSDCRTLREADEYNGHTVPVIGTCLLPEGVAYSNIMKNLNNLLPVPCSGTNLSYSDLRKVSSCASRL